MSAARQSRSGASAASDQQKKIIAGAVFGVLLLGVLYYELADVFFTPTPPPAAPPVILSGPSPAAPTPNAASTAPSAGPSSSPAIRTTGSSAAALDPTLHMQAMLVTEAVVYNGSGRNIFSTSAPPPATFTPLPKVTGPIRPSGVTPPTYVQPTGPPPLPPIDLKFFGLATSPADGHRQAFLLHGDDVFLAGNGDIVLRKYRIVAIGPASIQIEDLTNNNKQTLPLLVNP